MQFMPSAALCCSMLFDPPFAGTIQLRPVLLTINCSGPTGQRVHFWQGHCWSSPAERGMIGNCKLDPNTLA
jgi:hypothetical protein